MEGKDNIFFWKQLPDRDEALEVIYKFLRALANKDPENAGRFVIIKDMRFFIMKLHDALVQYLEMVLEDEQWEEYEDKNLALELTDPAELDENLTRPEFSGKTFELLSGENISLQVGLHGQVTPIRLHFQLTEVDELYFLRLHRITAE